MHSSSPKHMILAQKMGIVASFAVLFRYMIGNWHLGIVDDISCGIGMNMMQVEYNENTYNNSMLLHLDTYHESDIIDH